MKAVYTPHKSKRKRILKEIENKEYGSFINLPRNVIKEQVGQRELVNRDGNDFSLSLFTYLAGRYPEFTFYLEANPSEGNKVYVTQTFVFVDKTKECLGTLRWSYYNDVMEFRNQRVSADIKRGDCKKTSKLTVAKNLFACYFYPLTLPEEMWTVQDDVLTALTDHSWSLKRGRDAAVHTIIDKVTAMLRQESPALLEFVNAHGMGKELEAKEKDKEAIGITKRIKDAVTDGKGRFILIKDGMYYSTAAGKIKRMKRDDLPEDIRTAIGLLKVAEDNTAIDGVGYKATGDKFYITEELNFDFDE